VSLRDLVADLLEEPKEVDNTPRREGVEKSEQAQAKLSTPRQEVPLPPSPMAGQTGHTGQSKLGAGLRLSRYKNGIGTHGTQQEPGCFLCSRTTGVWEINKETCWAVWVCRGCQGRVRMPNFHLCDPDLPLTAPCKGKKPRPWVCSQCEAQVEIESVEEIDGRTLTFWSCPRGCSYGVAPTTLRTPPVMVPRTEQ